MDFELRKVIQPIIYYPPYLDVPESENSLLHFGPIRIKIE